MSASIMSPPLICLNFIVQFCVNQQNYAFSKKHILFEIGTNQPAERGSSRQDLVRAKANINVCKSADKVCCVCTLFNFDPMCAASF